MSSPREGLRHDLQLHKSFLQLEHAERALLLAGGSAVALAPWVYAVSRGYERMRQAHMRIVGAVQW